MPSRPLRALFLPGRSRPDLGRRATAIVAALAIEALLLLALLSLSQAGEPPPEAQLTEVNLSASDFDEPETEQPTPDESPPPTARPTPQPVEPVIPTPVPTPPPALIPLPTAPQVPKPAERPPPPAVEGPAYGPPNPNRPRADDSQRVGTAPDGTPLYAAQWYRQPGAEFDGFLTAASPGYGLMACRTIPNFYVTDCVPLSETPGSMLTRSMLAGAGVLRVRPPRLGGRSLVGSWVRIRIDYTVRRE